MTPDDAPRRATAVVLFGLCLALLAVSVVLLVLQSVSGIPLPTDAASVSSSLIFVVAGLVYCAVGTLIAYRQPRNTIGWLVLVVGVCFSIVMTTSTYVDWAAATRPGELETAAWVYALFGWTWVPAVGLMATFVVLLFPDGRLPSPRWRWLAWISGILIVATSVLMIISPDAFAESTLAGVANPLSVELPVRVTGDDVFVLLLACMVASVAAAVLRYRRAGDVERHQLRWLVTASAFFAGFCLTGLAAAAAPFPADVPVSTEVINHVLPLAFCAFPLAIAAAVLRYRLYEINVVISRTIVVALLSAFITVVYVAIVVGIGQLVDSGDQPDLALSLTATAVVAVAFQPVRERVRRWANRLVYGDRATPYEVLSRFADRMVRTYDASQLLPVMASTVGQGIGASRADIWLRGDAGFVRAASWPGDDGSPGSAASLSELTDDRVVPVVHHDELLGGIAVTKRAGEALSTEEDRLLAEVAAQAGLVLRNVRLIEDLRASRQRLVAAQDEERRRLERNLHDGAQQSLVALTLMLRMTRSRVTGATAGGALDRAGDELQRAIAELRELARGIYPAVLAERGLGPALTSLAERSPVPVVVDDRLDGRLPADVERTFYFVAAEALAGAAPGATDLIDIRVARPNTAATLEITGVADDDEDLIWLRDRVAVVDGTVTRPAADGGPLLFTVPLAAALGAAERARTAVTAAGARP